MGCRIPPFTAYLCVNRKIWFPAVWRYYFAHPVLATFRCYFPYILHRIPEFLLGRPEGWGLLQPVWPCPFICLSDTQSTSLPLHHRHVQRRSSPSAEGDMRSIYRIGAMIRGIHQIHLKAPSRRRRLRNISTRGIASRRRRDHH